VIGLPKFKDLRVLLSQLPKLPLHLLLPQETFSLVLPTSLITLDTSNQSYHQAP